VSGRPGGLSSARDKSFRKPRTLLGTIILNFVPSWFAVNMGTGIVSVLLYTSPHSFPGLKPIAASFYVLNLALFVVFLALTITRYALYPWVFWRMLSYPKAAVFVGTFPMGLATIINATVLIAVPMFGPWARYLVQALWWMDVVLSVLSCFAMPMVMFHIHDLALESMTAAWLLPIVPTVVAAASGSLVASILPARNAIIVIFTSYVLWGIGMGLSFIVMGMYFHRLAIHNLPNSEVIVSAFLPLGPLGQGAYGIVKLAQAGQKVYPSITFANAQNAGDVIYVISTLLGLVIWGLGWWWLIHGSWSVLIRYVQTGLTFNMGFWGFIFPLGVFIAATIVLAEALPSAFLSWLAVVFIIILVCLWIYVAGDTIANALNRKLFVAPCLITAASEDTNIWGTDSETCAFDAETNV
jgi:C4-dicarboxylate transporter/malic acid transport protein